MTLLSERKDIKTMKFNYIENDPMDEVPAPVIPMILRFIACVAYMVFYLMIWCAIFGWRPF